MRKVKTKSRHLELLEIYIKKIIRWYALLSNFSKILKENKNCKLDDLRNLVGILTNNLNNGKSLDIPLSQKCLRISLSVFVILILEIGNFSLSL